MQIAFYFLIGLIGATPALIFFENPLVDGFLVAFCATIVAIIGFSIRPGEAGYVVRIARPLVLYALIPATWILVQALPLPIDSLVHPIWLSAKAALDRSILGSVSIDRGSTMIAFASYFAAASLVFISLAVTVDRSRADQMLFWLAAVTTFSAILAIGLQWNVNKLFAQFQDTVSPTQLVSISALGIIINATAAIRAVERYETGRSRQESAFAKFIRGFGTSILALSICVIATAAGATPPLLFAVALGSVTFALVLIIRRSGLGPWVNIIFALTAVVVALAIVASNWDAGDITLRFASSAPAEAIQAAQSMLSDTRWTGNGANTFRSLAPIYMSVDRSMIEPNAPTSAAAIAIELGKPAFWIIVSLAIIVLMQLLRGALQRGRDSFYSTAGASCIVMLTLEAFCDSSLFEKATTIIACSIIGLAFAQSISRTHQPA